MLEKSVRREEEEKAANEEQISAIKVVRNNYRIISQQFYIFLTGDVF